MSSKKNKDAGFTDDPVHGTTGSGALSRGKSWFLGIGIDQYEHFDRLNNAVKDVKDVLALLEDQYEVDQKITLFDQEATRENISDTLEELIDKVQPDDKLLVYFSGHGYLREKTGYWIPVDAEKNRRGKFIRNRTLVDLVKDIKARHILLISDSCFSGAFLFERDAIVGDAAIEELEKDKSRWVISSGRQTEKVSDGDPGENSPFAASFLKVLRENRKPKINVALVADRAVKLTRYKVQQMPQVCPLRGVDHEGGQYVFCRKQQTPAWQSAWQQIQSLPEENLYQVAQKIQQLDEYVDTFEKAENIGDAYELGEYLEEKQAFFRARSSLFRLRKFARKTTHFREEAQQLIEELKKGYVVPEEPEPEPEPEPSAPKRPEKKQPQKQTPSPASGSRYGSFTDPRDGQTYRTIVLNGQTWMANNLKFDVGEGCWFYDDDPRKEYGRLYTWETAQKACPPGWRLPTREEWEALRDSFGDAKKAYKALIKGGKSGFAALLGGRRKSRGKSDFAARLGFRREYNVNFDYLGDHGYYWSATESDVGNAWSFAFLRGYAEMYRNDFPKSWGFSCRCLQDAPPNGID